MDKNKNYGTWYRETQRRNSVGFTVLRVLFWASVVGAWVFFMISLIFDLIQ